MYVFNKDKLVDMFQSAVSGQTRQSEEHKPGEVVPIEIYKVPVTDSLTNSLRLIIIFQTTSLTFETLTIVVPQLLKLNNFI